MKKLSLAVFSSAILLNSAAALARPCYDFSGEWATEFEQRASMGWVYKQTGCQNLSLAIKLGSESIPVFDQEMDGQARPCRPDASSGCISFAVKFTGTEVICELTQKDSLSETGSCVQTGKLSLAEDKLITVEETTCHTAPYGKIPPKKVIVRDRVQAE